MRRDDPVARYKAKRASRTKAAAHAEQLATRPGRHPIVWLAFAPLVASVTALVASVSLQEPIGVLLAPFAALPSAFLAACVWDVDPWPRRSPPGWLTIEGDAVSWNGKPFARKGALRHATHFHRDDLGNVVEIDGPDRVHRFAIADSLVAHAVVGRLGFAPGRKTGHYTAASGIFGWSNPVRIFVVSGVYLAVVACVVAIAQVDFDAVEAAVGVASVAASSLTLYLLFSSTEIVVTEEAVATRWAGHERVMPLSSIVTVEGREDEEVSRTEMGTFRRTYHVADIVLSEGGRRTIRFGSSKSAASRRTDFVAQVHAAIAARRARDER